MCWISKIFVWLLWIFIDGSFINRHLSRQKLVLRIIKATCCIKLSKMEVENAENVLQPRPLNRPKVVKSKPSGWQRNIRKVNKAKGLTITTNFLISLFVFHQTYNNQNTENFITRSNLYEFEGSGNSTSKNWNRGVHLSMRLNRVRAAMRRKSLIGLAELLGREISGKVHHVAG